MADVTIPYPEAGLASFEQLDSHLQKFLISGNHPELATYPMEVTSGQAITQFQVLGLVAGKLVPAVEGGGSPVKAQFIATQAVAGSAPAGTKIPVFYSGCFEPAALAWDASYSTDALKEAAFRDSPTPTQIIIRKRL